MSEPHGTTSLRQLLLEKKLLVCCGSGGVGKTTTASALALMAAFLGRRTLVLTIDPARRLANSLGLEHLDNTPRTIDLNSVLHLAPKAPSTFHAMMLDPVATLNEMMRRLAPDEAAAERVLNNRVWRLFAGRLHGTQEFAALEKLHELYSSGDYDIVILDTPPTQNALEFFDTPTRLSRFLDERVMRWFLPAVEQPKTFIGKLLNPGALVVGLLGKMVGEEFTRDLVEFFATILAMRAAIHSHTTMVEEILRDGGTGFVVITSPDRRRIDEALFFHDKLSGLEQGTAAFIINRVSPGFSVDQVEMLTEQEFMELARQLSPDPGDAEHLAGLYSQLKRYYARLVTAASRERESVSQLAGRVGQKMLHLVPQLSDEVNSLEDLLTVGEFLLSPQDIPAPAKG